jgi:hypothetical protein
MASVANAALAAADAAVGGDKKKKRRKKKREGETAGDLSDQPSEAEPTKEWAIKSPNRHFKLGPLNQGTLPALGAAPVIDTYESIPTLDSNHGSSMDPTITVHPLIDSLSIHAV